MEKEEQNTHSYLCNNYVMEDILLVQREQWTCQ